MPTDSGYADAQDDFADAPAFTGWGDSWLDLDLDTDLDLVLTNGDIPVSNLSDDAEPIQVLENRSTAQRGGSRTWGSGPKARTGCRRTDAASLRPTTTTTATWTSRSTRSAGR
jgi:hypothetical protein